MLVADTSAWVEYLRRTGSPSHLALLAAVDDDTVILLEPVRAELLTGARSKHELAELRRLLEGFAVELVQPRDDFDAACDLYHRCRAVGITPRGLIDCLIAAMALRAGHPLLHADRDLAAIAAVMGISEAPGSLAA
ncbi:MAG: PIN domain nuclease [Actinomycetota bacterium]|nr:PIN domain nuclease [Actinomycetota bacterium]